MRARITLAFVRTSWDRVEGAARFYARIAADAAGEARETGALTDFFAARPAP
jgi:hypothetical protein